MSDLFLLIHGLMKIGLVIGVMVLVATWPRRSSAAGTVVRHGGLLFPDGHFKLPHLWPLKLPQAGRPNYGLVMALSAMRELASLSR